MGCCYRCVWVVQIVLEYYLLTGATDGIGEAIAMELGRRGMDLFLISRSEDKLEKTKEKVM